MIIVALDLLWLILELHSLGEVIFEATLGSCCLVVEAWMVVLNLKKVQKCHHQNILLESLSEVLTKPKLQCFLVAANSKTSKDRYLHDSSVSAKLSKTSDSIP